MSDQTHEKHSVVLSQQDIADAKAYLAKFEKNGEAFWEMIGDLLEFRRRKLYLVWSESFGDFCWNFMGWSRQRFHQLMTAYEIRESLPEKSKINLTSETHARALAPVPARQRARVVEEAKEATNGQVTARAITEAAERVTKPAPKPQPADAPKKEQLLDATGFPVPDNIAQLFHRVDEVKEVLQRIATTRGLMRRVEETKDALWQPVNKSTAMSDLDRIYAELKQALPFAVCPYCQGRDETKSHCTACKTRGVISEFMWKTAIPEELKSVREKACKR